MSVNKKELKNLLDAEFGRKKDKVIMLILVVVISIILIFILAKYMELFSS